MATDKNISFQRDGTPKSKIKKGGIKRWLFRIVLFVLLLIGLLVGAVLQPGLFYKHKTTSGRFTIYHSDTLDAAFLPRLQEAVRLAEKSEAYDPGFSMDICLGESTYPNIIKHFFGDAFAWGFYNKVVIRGKIDSKNNVHQSNWNLTQLLAHEMTHCLQFNKLGLFHSNPLAGYPEWKWEGYPEYVARKEIQEPLTQSIERLLISEQAASTGKVTLADSTETNPMYYKNWLLVKYWLQTRRLSYRQLLKDTVSEESIRKEMMVWYQANK